MFIIDMIKGFIEQIISYTENAYSQGWLWYLLAGLFIIFALIIWNSIF